MHQPTPHSSPQHASRTNATPAAAMRHARHSSPQELLSNPAPLTPPPSARIINTSCSGARKGPPTAFVTRPIESPSTCAVVQNSRRAPSNTYPHTDKTQDATASRAPTTENPKQVGSSDRSRLKAHASHARTTQTNAGSPGNDETHPDLPDRSLYGHPPSRTSLSSRTTDACLIPWRRLACRIAILLSTKPRCGPGKE